MATEAKSRVLVLLAKSERPNYQEFLCPDCDMPVAQVDNADILGLSDVIDFDSRRNILIGVPHRGRLRSTVGNCKTRYYFTLGETK